MDLMRGPLYGRAAESVWEVATLTYLRGLAEVWILVQRERYLTTGRAAIRSLCPSVNSRLRGGLNGKEN